MQKNLFLIGKIINVHGIRGEVKILPISEQFFQYVKEGKTCNEKLEPIKISYKETQINQKIIVAKIKGVETRNRAEELKNTSIFVQRKDLVDEVAEGHYLQDLVGLKVQNSKGVALGEVIDFYNFGAGDILEIQNTAEKKELIGFNQVLQVNLQEGYIIVEL
jgi:16S rRNA processing protein RimM